jgi:hypothetical protein
VPGKPSATPVAEVLLSKLAVCGTTTTASSLVFKSEPRGSVGRLVTEIDRRDAIAGVSRAARSRRSVSHPAVARLPVLRRDLRFGSLDLGRIRHAIHAQVISSAFELDQFCLYLCAGQRLALSERRNCRKRVERRG